MKRAIVINAEMVINSDTWVNADAPFQTRLSGDTYPAKELIKALGAKWNGISAEWVILHTFDEAQAVIDKVSAMDGTHTEEGRLIEIVWRALPTYEDIDAYNAYIA